MKKNVPAFVLSLTVCGAALGLIVFPQEVSRAVRDGLSLCTDTLLPTLFPFLVLSGFLIKSGLAAPLGRILEPIMQPLFHLPGVCSSAFLLGLVGGYPTGAKTALALYRSGQCSRREAEQTLAFCNNCGPGFLLGSIGFGVFGSLSCGVLLFFTHALAAVLTGILLAAPHPISLSTGKTSTEKPSMPAAFVASVTESMQAFLNLSAFVLCFAAITCLAQLSGLISALAVLLPFSQENSTCFLLGLLEMSTGTLQLSHGTAAEQMILTSAIVGWGGLSVHCQVLSLMEDTELSPSLYFKGKALHALLSALLCTLFLTRSMILGAAVFITVATVRFRKKAVEKKRQIYYNGEKSKLKELRYP